MILTPWTEVEKVDFTAYRLKSNGDFGIRHDFQKKSQELEFSLTRAT